MASFLGELKRRNVFKVVVAYAIVGWLLIQIAATVLPIFGTPDWVLQAFTFLVILGFPLAVVFSWAFELTPEGLERTKSVPVAESITPATGRRLNVAIIGLMAVAIGLLVVDHYVLEEAPVAATSDAAVSAERNSIAVLPFDNRSARDDDQFFVDGIHDDILTQLARIGSMRVISRTSVMPYRDTDKNIRTIGAELGVATILEGGVQRAGDTIRINVQLIDTTTDEHLWAETYDRMLTVENVFAIQSEMASAIATALQASLSPEDIARLASVPTQSTRAYDFYLRGNEYFNRPDDSTFMPLAVEMYGRAVAEDPEFAVAWAALSRAHSNMHWYAVDRTPQRLELSMQAAQRALAIDPNLPEAHLALGSYYDHGFRDYAQAEREFSIAERAIPGDPALIEATAYMLRRMGNPTEALARLERLLDRDPRNTDLLYQTGITNAYLQQFAAAENYFDRALELAPDSGAAHYWRVRLPWFRDGDVGRMRAAAANLPPSVGVFREVHGWIAALYGRDDATALRYADRLEGNAVSVQGTYLPKPLMRGWAHWIAGRRDLAEAEFRAAIALTDTAIATSRDDPRLRIALAQSYAGLGEREIAERIAREAMALMPRSLDETSGQLYQKDVIVGVLAPLGDVEATVAELDAYLGARSLFTVEGLLPDPRFDPVRDDPRFQALVQRYRRQ
jgi:TolB-like protein/Tfp pilus assembly protein PilF